MKNAYGSSPAAWILALTGLLLPLAAGAQAPFDILRSADDPALTRSAAVHAVVASGPFDDDAGTLSDGVDYYYVVLAAAAAPVTLSVHKNPMLDAVRIGFDDGNLTSALVDPLASTVDVSPASIPADGVTTATVTVTPRDADGVPLGTGLAVSIDAPGLAPGAAAGPLVDEGDGRYTLPVASTVAGSAVVRATVEGLFLTSEPALTYEPTGPADGCFVGQALVGCTPEQAIQQVIDELQALIDADPGAPFAPKLGEAIAKLQDALDRLAESPPDETTAIDKIQSARDKLLVGAVAHGFDPVLASQLATRLQSVIDALG